MDKPQDILLKFRSIISSFGRLTQLKNSKERLSQYYLMILQKYQTGTNFYIDWELESGKKGLTAPNGLLYIKFIIEQSLISKFKLGFTRSPWYRFRLFRTYLFEDASGLRSSYFYVFWLGDKAPLWREYQMVYFCETPIHVSFIIELSKRIGYYLFTS